LQYEEIRAMYAEIAAGVQFLDYRTVGHLADLAEATEE
jgi:hypothetical protein